jgi:hypothetical protein
MKLQPFQAKFTHGQYFRHIDGGYYQFDKSIYFADDQNELIVYRHVWPFEPSEWGRRVSEFLKNFKPIDEAEFLSVSSQSEEERIKLQEAIAQSKQTRRNKKLAKEIQYDESRDLVILTTKDGVSHEIPCALIHDLTEVSHDILKQMQIVFDGVAIRVGENDIGTENLLALKTC